MAPHTSVLYTALENKIPGAARAEGMYVYDADGKAYLDCAAGIAVVNIGHGVPEVIDAMHEQAKKVCFVYGGTFTSESRQRLADKVTSLASMGESRLFLCSGGSEAMESVIKMARQYHLERGNPRKFKIISRWQSYHGNTMATLAIGGRPSWRTKYEPYFFNSPHIPPCNCYHCPYRLEHPDCGVVCADELERAILYEGPENVAAFVLEPITGTTSTATAPPAEYIRRVRAICDKYDVLLCADEVITGFGRTGTNFAMDHFGIPPDLCGVAKGMASGYVPVGGVIAHEKVVDVIVKGTGVLTHSFTYSANPLVCAVADAALDYLNKNNLVQRSKIMGEIFLQKLKPLEELPYVGQVRGVGLLLGIEFVQDKKTRAPLPESVNFSSKVTSRCFEDGLIVIAGVQGAYDGTRGEAMQISPPFIITEEQMDFVVATLRKNILAVGETV